MADKTGPPWGDVEELDGKKHSIRQQIYDLSLQILDDVTDLEKQRDDAKEAQQQKEAAELGQTTTIRNACMKSFARRKEDTSTPQKNDEVLCHSFLATSANKTPKTSKKDGSSTSTISSDMSFAKLMSDKEEKKEIDKKRKYEMSLKREERKQKENEKKIAMHEDRMKKMDEQLRIGELEIRLHHEQQMKSHEQVMKMMEVVLNQNKNK